MIGGAALFARVRRVAAVLTLLAACRGSSGSAPHASAPPAIAAAHDASVASARDAGSDAASVAVADVPPGERLGIETACNGVDDDGDGLVDVLLPMAENACQSGAQGVCASGFAACRDGARICDAPPPTAEVKDGLDNDCNGVVDDVPAANVRARALIIAPKYAWTDARSDIDTVASLLDQAGIAYDMQRPNTDWDVRDGAFAGYALVIIPGYLEGAIVRPMIVNALESFATSGGVVVVMKPIGDVDVSGALELAGLTSVTHARDVTSLRIDGANAPALAAIDSPEERVIPLSDEQHPEPTDVWLMEPGANTTALAHAMRGRDVAGVVATRRRVGRGAIYAWGHDLATYAANRCYVNCFEPAGDVLRLFFRDALREGAAGHIVLKHAIPGGAGSALLLTHDIDAPDAYNAGAWGQPGALQMAALERSLGVRATYNMTTDYVAGYFQPSIVKALCSSGMCPVGAHSVRHLGTFAAHPRGTCQETKATYGTHDRATLCAEIKVPLEILTPLTGKRPRAWRSPYLLLNPAQFELLAQNGIEFDSGFGIGDLKYNLPVDLEHVGFKQQLFHHQALLEFPVSCEDGIDALENGAHKRIELQQSNRTRFRDAWRYVLLRNAANEAITTALIHPSRGHDMPDDNLEVKVEEVDKLVRFAKSRGIAVSTIDEFGQFWRARAQTSVDATFTSSASGGGAYRGSITTGALSVKDLAIELGDTITSFECPGCGAIELLGKRVVLASIGARARLAFTATVAAPAPAAKR